MHVWQHYSTVDLITNYSAQINGHDGSKGAINNKYAGLS